MGTSTSSVAVPFKVESIAFYNVNPPTEEWQKALCILDHNLPDVPNNGVDLGKGWAYYFDYCEKYTQHNSTLYCDLIVHAQKGHKIFVVNESPFARGGEKNISIFADSKQPLEAFLQDMQATFSILQLAAVTQTL